MNLSALSFKYRTVVWVLSALVFIVGYPAYLTLGRLEDPSFAIKQAVVSASYPGATPLEVAQEVAEPLESAIQQLDEIDYLVSFSQAGQTTIKVYLKSTTPAARLPQVWDELRRKVQLGAMRLPPGAGTPNVNDDFGDVYGVLFYIHGDGFTLEELYDYARELRKDLLLVQGVASVELLGAPREAVFIDLQPGRLMAMSGLIGALKSAIQGQGSVVRSGTAEAGPRRVAILPSGSFDSVDAIREILLGSNATQPLRLGDIAVISRGLVEPPTTLLRYNNFPAIALGVSAAAGGNVVTMGDAVKKRVQELRETTPVGIELGIVSMQSDSVKQAVSGFVVGLIESVAIVVGVLLLAMGLRAGLLIGTILLMTIFGTFIIMLVMGVDLQRISLGALIIALGMLVDNAIVVVEGMMAGGQQGKTREEAANEVVGQTTWPLLGATGIAVLAFAPIGLSPDSTGDYCGSLYTVIWLSLLLSWVFALTSTPVVGAMFLGRSGSSEKTPGAATIDPYDTPVFRAFRSLLEGLLAWRFASLGVLLVLLVVSVIGFGKARQGFFPSSARPQFMVEFWLEQGQKIETVDASLMELSDWVRGLEGVTAVASSAGQGTLRFELTYAAEFPNPTYGQLMISVDSERRIEALRRQIEERLISHHPEAQGWTWRMVLGPGGEAKIQARLRGPDPAVLRELGSQVQAVMEADPYATAIRSDWRQRELIARPQLDEGQMARLGLTRREVNDSIAMAYDGMNVGVYREGDQLIPIFLRARVDADQGVENVGDVLIPTPAGSAVLVDQISRGVTIETQDPMVVRRNRVPTLTVMCDPATGSAAALFNRMAPQIEAIPLPVGYTLEWGGEREKSANASAGLAALMPVCFGGMVLILIALFNNLRQPLIILLTVPLAIIGVTVGLLLTGAEFGFMPILGVLSLTGMLIKNAIVLIDEANSLVGRGIDPYDAIVTSAVSRSRPVTMAALTTVLGMIPLLTDVFFKDMAIVIMFGLSFATVLTLLVVPLLYVVVYGVYPSPAAPARG